MTMKPQINLLADKVKRLLSRKGIAVLLAATLVTSSAFAGVEDNKEKAIKNLREEFASAKDVQWKVTENYLKASFNWNNQQLEVFYNYEGEMIAKSRHIEPTSLPLDAQQTITRKYPGYRFDETVEYDGIEGDHYFYTSLVKDNTKILLQITTQGDVSVYRK